jgi:hypothetical protein
MEYSSDCPECDSPIALQPRQRSCPVCNVELSEQGWGERRAPTTVPFFRDWVTDLRMRGGDFDQAAARAASEIAHACARRGLRPQEIFQIARAAYYEALRAHDSDASGEKQASDGGAPLRVPMPLSEVSTEPLLDTA